MSKAKVGHNGGTQPASKVPKIPFTVRHKSGVYYARFRYPTPLLIAKPDLPEVLKRSLRTRDPQKARTEVVVVKAEFDKGNAALLATYAKAGRGDSPPSTPPIRAPFSALTMKEKRKLVFNHFVVLERGQEPWRNAFDLLESENERRQLLADAAEELRGLPWTFRRLS